ncbi:PAS domain S-box protein [Fontibacter flavus]|uniref:histidine kinase n=1 Tax=Fontibacter flavus TaxID=654838 RepID=A0ABV6FN64_9BACT
MTRGSKKQFHNILLTLKRYQDSTFELLYISSEIRRILSHGDKFYQEKFFNEIFPTLPEGIFEYLFKKLGTGDQITCPILINKSSFQFVEIEGYVIAQEDQSYLINALITPKEWENNIKFSWLMDQKQGAIYSGLPQENKVKTFEEWKSFILKKFDFFNGVILDKFPQSKEVLRTTIFPNHLYLSKTALSSQFCLIELEYFQKAKEHIQEELPFVQEDLIYYEFDRKTDSLQLSGALENILGYSKSYFDDFKVENWEKLIHPEDLHLYQRRFEHSNRVIYRVLHRNDYYVFVEDQVKEFKSKKKEQNIFLGIISDITALKEIEKDLMDKKSVLDELTGVVPGMVYLMKALPDYSHKFLFISDGCQQLTELDPNDIITDENNLEKVIHPEDLQQVKDADKKAYLTDSKFESYFRIVTPSGKEKWVYGASNRLRQYENESIWAGIFVDFTYTKQKELESSLNLKRYKTLFEENPLPIFQYDQNGKILDVNKTFIQKIDIQDPNLLIGNNMFEFLGDNPITKAYLDSIENGYGFYEGPYISYFNNKLFHLRMNAKELESGKTYQAILEDISEQEYVHNIISELTEKTSKFSGKRFFDELTQFIANRMGMEYCFIAEVDEEKTTANLISFFKKGVMQNPYSYQLENTPCLDCVTNNEPFIILTDAYKKYQDDKPLVDMGINTYMGVPISDLNDKRLGLLVLMDEKPKPYHAKITDLLKILADRIGAELSRLNFEKRLIASEQLFRSIAENFPKGKIDVLDRQFTYIYTEGKEYQSMGVTAHNLLGTSFLAKYSNYKVREKVKTHLERIFTGETESFEVNLDDQNYLKIGVPLVNNQGEIDRILIVTQNITESKHAEQEREQLIKDLKSQNEELQRFAYITSHNLRAPIVNITSLLDLYDDKNPENPENKEVIENLKVSTNILNGTLEDLIEVVSIKKNKIPKIELINFLQLTQNVEKSLSKQIADSRAEIHKDFTKAPNINYIYSHLENFMMNLLTNAIKYKHPDRHPVIFIRTSLEGDYTLLTFEDNGIGINLERYGDRLFGLYQRFHSHVEGKGLGLYLVREQIRAHDGNLKVESTVGKGTRFKIYLRNMKLSLNKISPKENVV